MNKLKIGLGIAAIIIVWLVAINAWVYTTEQNQINSLRIEQSDLLHAYASTHSHTDSDYNALAKQKTQLETWLSVNMTLTGSLDSQIGGLQNELSNKNDQIANLIIQLKNASAPYDAQIKYYLNQISSLNTQIQSLNTQIEYLSSLLPIAESSSAIEEKVRDSVMEYIKFEHSETLQYMQNLTWTGGRITPPNIVGAETYRYISPLYYRGYVLGWNFTMSYPVVPNPIYKINVNYTTVFGLNLGITWKGSWQNWNINETYYDIMVYPSGE